jgi:hypothetical protein
MIAAAPTPVEAAPIARFAVMVGEDATPTTVHCRAHRWFTDCRVHTTEEPVYKVRVKRLAPHRYDTRIFLIYPAPDSAPKGSK